MFAKKARENAPRRAQHARPRNRKRLPSLDSLEGRELMSLGAEFIGPVNATTRNAQFESDNASSAGGASVVVWTDSYSSTDRDIRAQRYNSFGGKIGQEIVVSYSSLDESSPAVAMDDQGRFEVVWVQKAAGGDSNVVAQRFDADGNAVGSVIQVGAGTFRESDPDIATDLAGNFAVSYTRETNNNNPDVFLKRYNSAGQLLSVSDVAVSSRAENHSSIAMTPDGRIAVAWETAYSATDHDILLTRFSSTGTLIDVAGVGSSTLNDVNPSVAMDNYGNGVVVWEKAGNIQARRFDYTGAPAFYDFTIAGTTATERNPSVAMRRSGGGFVVAYESLNSGVRTLVAEVSAYNSITTQDAGLRSAPSVSISAYGDYMLTYTALDGSDQNIRGRRGYLLS